jgi:hypothetical protein
MKIDIAGELASSRNEATRVWRRRLRARTVPFSLNRDGHHIVEWHREIIRRTSEVEETLIWGRGSCGM